MQEEKPSQNASNGIAGEDRATTITRRAAIVGTAGLVGTSGVGSVGASKNQTGSSTEPGRIAPPPSIKHGKKLKQLQFRFPLVIDKGRIIEYINKSSYSDKERKQARENIKDIWSNIEIEETNVDQNPGPHSIKTTIYRLQGSVTDAKNIIDNYRDRGFNSQKLARSNNGGSGLGAVINSGAENVAEEHDDVSISWDPTDSHKIQNYFAGKNLGLDEQYCNYLEVNGDDPDNWEYDISGVPEEWEENYKEPGRRWAHARSPVLNLGSSPSWAKEYMEKSQNADSNYRKYEYMGYALHFLSDAGNPMHTGEFVPQMERHWIHSTYEASAEKHLYYQDDDLDPTNYLINNVNFDLRDDLGPSDYKEVDDPDKPWEFSNKWANHVDELAHISNNYSTDHVQKTIEYGKDADVIELDNDIEQQVEYLFKETTRFMMGFVEEYNGDV